MIQLARPNFIERSSGGGITGIYCKLCGMQIAHPFNNRIVYSQQYMEIKLQFEDGSFHVTNLCKVCAADIGDHPDKMEALYEADIAEMAEQVPSLADLSGKGAPRLYSMMVGVNGIP